MLIDNVLDLTQSEAGTLPIERLPVDLASLARARVDRLRGDAAAKGMELALELAPTVGVVRGDERRIGQCIDHLLENALNYCSRGARILLHGDGTAEQARIVISDNGPGIPADRQQAIFEPLVRAEQARTGAKAGMGLPLARQLVQAHGGTLQLVSKKGQGTMILIELPRG